MNRRLFPPGLCQPRNRIGNQGKPADHVQIGSTLVNEGLELCCLGVCDRQQPLAHCFFQGSVGADRDDGRQQVQGISEMIRNQNSNWVVMVIRVNGAKACRKFMAGYA